MFEVGLFVLVGWFFWEGVYLFGLGIFLVLFGRFLVCVFLGWCAVNKKSVFCFIIVQKSSWVTYVDIGERCSLRD